MFGQLKDRFLLLQEEITTSVNKQLAPSEEETNDLARRNGSLDAGSNLLETWQNCWEELHLGSERNAKGAARCDGLITSVKNRSEKQWCNVIALQTHIPKVNKGIQEIMGRLGDMESMLGDVEISLLALEDTIDAREMQEKQLEQRFQLAMYQERRKAEFNELANRLQNDFEKKKRLQQNSSSSNALKKIGNYAENRLRERQENYPSSSASGRLQVPARHDPDASLESVDLGDTDEGTMQNLEAFLNEGINSNDALYDVSPLPKDEVPLHKSESSAGLGDLLEVPINNLSIENDLSPATDTVTPPLDANSSLSRADSFYYTPDITTETLSEVCLD